MHALIVVAHPDPASLTHAVANAVASGLTGSGHGHVAEIADLNAEGFDPRFTAADIAAHLRQAPPPADVAAIQARLDRAHALVLVYPVYWWSMPALLKGWIERVFSNGWAYDDRADGKVSKMLRHLPVHLVAIGGAEQETYLRHGYLDAMRTQIEHGIFGYCGAPVASSALFTPSDPGFPAAQFDRARDIGRGLFDAGRAGTDRAVLPVSA